jgi:ferric-dicitrate binding protein FerR (iron transport regulator)
MKMVAYSHNLERRRIDVNSEHYDWMEEVHTAFDVDREKGRMRVTVRY